MKRTCLAALIASLMLSTAAFADDKIVKIGQLDDQSSLYADSGGPGLGPRRATWRSRTAGLRNKGWTIDVISADHQNKPDVGVGIARQWFDVDKVDAIVDVPNSGVALAVTGVAKEKNGVLLDSGAASSDLTGKACNANMIHWAYDTYALANGTGKAIVKAGGDTWFFVTADYAFGHALQRDTTAVVEANGGKVLGSANVPINTPDFSSFLLQAQASKAKVVGLANAGGDTVNSIKQAHEFGIVAGGQKLAALLGLHLRRPCARPRHRAGADLHRDLLLGHERRHARLLQALRGAHEEPRHADHGAGGDYCLDPPLSQDPRGDGRQSA